MSKCLTSTLIAVLIAGGPAFAVAQDRDRFRRDFDAFAAKAMERIEAVPGMAAAVVDGTGAVHVGHYGIADAETGAKVTPDTRFYIASSTKSFTALAIAAMAARGEVDLDAPLASWSPDSGVPADIAGQVSLTDLLSHRSGVDNSPIAYRMAYTGDWTPQQLWRLTSETRPNPEAPYGTFAYTNAGYNLATVLIEKRWGRDWRVLVDDEVLAPLGMTSTTARIDEVRAAGETVTSGHSGRTPGRGEPTYLQKTDSTMHSAGGLISTADDMALWLQAQVNDGVVAGRRVFPAGLIASTHLQRAADDDSFGPYVRTGYGLGWRIGRYGDDVLLHHFGNFSGSRAHVSFMPHRRLGVAVMINEDVFAGDFADLVANYAYDWFAGVPDLEATYDARLEELAAQRDRRRAGLAASEASRAQRPRTLTLSNAAYVGDYVSEAFGTMRIREMEDRLEAEIGVQKAKAENFTQPESIRVELTPFTGQSIVFTLGADGQPEALTFEGERFVRRR
jgi:CubicO group peptidase (beta-lactamase class C family)